MKKLKLIYRIYYCAAVLLLVSCSSHEKFILVDEYAVDKNGALVENDRILKSEKYTVLKSKKIKYALRSYNKSISDSNKKILNFIEEGKYQEAEVFLNILLDSYPSNYILLNNLALVYEFQGKNEAALEKYFEAYELAPGNKYIKENIRNLNPIK